MEGVVFRLTARQLITVIALASLPLAGGIYTLRRPQWFTGGTTWTCLSGVLILLAVSTIADRTRADALGVSVRRLLVYRRFVPWGQIDELYQAAAPMYGSCWGWVDILGSGYNPELAVIGSDGNTWVKQRNNDGSWSGWGRL